MAWETTGFQSVERITCALVFAMACQDMEPIEFMR